MSGPIEEPPRKSYASLFFKIFACVLIGIPLVAGVAYAGHGTSESWGSALAGFLILILVMMTSPSIGWWEWIDPERKARKAAPKPPTDPAAPADPKA